MPWPCRILFQRHQTKIPTLLLIFYAQTVFKVHTEVHFCEIKLDFKQMFKHYISAGHY